MAFNGAGVFVRLYSWVQDAINGIKIRADRMDNEDNGFATGLTDCVTRDGQSPALANLPMAGFRHTGVGDGVAATDYSTLGQLLAAINKTSATVTVASGGTSPVIPLPANTAGIVIITEAGSFGDGTILASYSQLGGFGGISAPIGTGAYSGGITNTQSLNSSGAGFTITAKVTGSNTVYNYSILNLRPF